MRTILITLLLLASGLNAQVVINEFNTGTPDFVELRNLSASPVDVGGWTVSSWWAQNVNLQSDSPYTLPSGTTIAGGGTLVLQENGTAGAPGTIGSCAIRTGSNYNWAQSYSVVVLLEDDQGQGVDYVYRNATQNPMSPPNLPASLTWTGDYFGTGSQHARNGDLDTDSASDWSAGGTPTPCGLNPGQAPAPEVALVLGTTGVGDATFTLTTSPPIPNAEFFGLYSMVDQTPDGSGPFFGLGIDALPFLYLPLVPQSPFHSTLDAAGGATAAFPPGTVPLGVFYEGRVAVLDLSAGAVKLSNVEEISF